MGLLSWGGERDQRKVRFFPVLAPHGSITTDHSEQVLGTFWSQALVEGWECCGVSSRENRYLERQTVHDGCLIQGWFSLLPHFLGLSSLKPHRCPLGIALSEVTTL